MREELKDIDFLTKIELTKFISLLKEILEDGYGEVTYQVKVTDGEVVLINLSKSNSYKPNNVII